MDGDGLLAKREPPAARQFTLDVPPVDAEVSQFRSRQHAVLVSSDVLRMVHSDATVRLLGSFAAGLCLRSEARR